MYTQSIRITNLENKINKTCNMGPWRKSSDQFSKTFLFRFFFFAGVELDTTTPNEHPSNLFFFGLNVRWDRFLDNFNYGIPIYKVMMMTLFNGLIIYNNTKP